MHTVENPGEGVAQIFTQIPGGQCFLDKIGRGSPIFGFIDKFFLILPGWVLCYMLYPPFPLTPPECITGHSDVSNRIKLLLPNPPRHRERAWFVWTILLTFVVEDIIGDNEWLLKNGMTPFSQNLFVDQQIYAAVWGQTNLNVYFWRRKKSRLAY